MFGVNWVFLTHALTVPSFCIKQSESILTSASPLHTPERPTYIMSCIRKQCKRCSDGTLLRADNVKGQSIIPVDFTGKDFKQSTGIIIYNDSQFERLRFIEIISVTTDQVHKKKTGASSARRAGYVIPRFLFGFIDIFSWAGIPRSWQQNVYICICAG